jgi:hypothetical protein
VRKSVGGESAPKACGKGKLQGKGTKGKKDCQ